MVGGEEGVGRRRLVVDVDADDPEPPGVADRRGGDGPEVGRRQPPHQDAKKSISSGWPPAPGRCSEERPRSPFAPASAGSVTGGAGAPAGSAWTGIARPAVVIPSDPGAGERGAPERRAAVTATAHRDASTSAAPPAASRIVSGRRPDRSRGTDAIKQEGRQLGSRGSAAATTLPGRRPNAKCPPPAVTIRSVDLARRSWARLSTLPTLRQDALLYAASGAFAGLTVVAAVSADYRAWGEMALVPYLLAAVACEALYFAFASPRPRRPGRGALPARKAVAAPRSTGRRSSSS